MLPLASCRSEVALGADRVGALALSASRWRHDGASRMLTQLSVRAFEGAVFGHSVAIRVGQRYRHVDRGRPLVAFTLVQQVGSQGCRRDLVPLPEAGVLALADTEARPSGVRQRAPVRTQRHARQRDKGGWVETAVLTMLGGRGWGSCWVILGLPAKTANRMRL
jgi:hypothetical protein